jgi:hypothetical protein
LLHDALGKEFTLHGWLLHGKENGLRTERFWKAEEDVIQKLKVGLMMREFKMQYANGYKAAQVKVCSLVYSRAPLIAVSKVNILDLLDITAFTLARVIGEYLDSKRAAHAVEEVLKFGPGGNRVRARTARQWLKKLGLVFGRYTKGVYVDGHERVDVVRYRNKVFIPQWQHLKDRIVVFKENGTYELLQG